MSHRRCVIIKILNIVLIALRQALLSAGEEWNTHKKLITINSRNPLRKAVPARFPYVTAEWTVSSKNGASTDAAGRLQGFAHLVEDSQKYKNSFCLDVIAGALDVDPFILRRMARGDSGGARAPEEENSEKEAVKAFKNVWASFDWTQYMSVISE
jgi:hypothetical protein